MRTITTNTEVFKLDELTDKGKQSALDKLWDINVDHDWWDCTYDDAKTVGILIQGFDVGRGNNCEATFDDYAINVAKAICKNHGKGCDTYQVALSYWRNYRKVQQKEHKNHCDIDYCGLSVLDCWEFENTNESNELNSEFERAIGEEYLSLLRNEYEHLTSEEVILETIEANEYEFTANGKLY